MTDATDDVDDVALRMKINMIKMKMALLLKRKSLTSSVPTPPWPSLV